jgi:hypothetical protein
VGPLGGYPGGPPLEDTPVGPPLGNLTCGPQPCDPRLDTPGRPLLGDNLWRTPLEAPLVSPLLEPLGDPAWGPPRGPAKGTSHWTFPPGSPWWSPPLDPLITPVGPLWPIRSAGPPPGHSLWTPLADPPSRPPWRAPFGTTFLGSLGISPLGTPFCFTPMVDPLG